MTNVSATTDSDDLVYRAFYLLSQHRSWDEWSHTGYRATLDKLGTVRVIHTLEDARQSVGGYYDEYPQGSTSPAGIVFEVTLPDGSVRFFQKDGTFDSYGSEDYSGGQFFEVRPEPIQTTTYVRKR